MTSGKKKLYIRTFGCQMNEYDSDRMADILAVSEGTEKTDRIEDADIILFNTCSVREKAQEKVFSDLGRVRALKRDRPDLLIGVGGCVASQEGEAIVARAPYVDLVFGPQTLHRLPELIARRRESGRSQVDIRFPEIEKFDRLPPAHTDGATAFVTIMEGCSKYCSYCVVPYTRGHEISRPLMDVLTEIAGLAAQGVREVTLLGQNVNAWRGRIDEAGTGIGTDAVSGASANGGADGQTGDLTLLLELVSELPGIERVRYTTSHPREFTPRLIDAHARLSKLARHVHLPVQSGAERILTAMKRGYTVLEYKSIVRRLRAACPDISLTSDFIVGFPGETAADFEQTLRLIEEIRFDASFSFVYSPRPGTPAADLPDDTPHEVKLERLQRLQALNDGHARAISEAMIGTVQRVLVEHAARRHEGELAARASNNRVVNFRGDTQLIGQFVDVRITGAGAHTLRGELVAQP